MIDYSADLYDPVYAELGVDATLTAGASEIELTVIDDTRQKIVTSGDVQTRSVEPGAYARIPELSAAGIVRTDYIGALLSFNGRTWTVYNFDLTGNPNGEDFGQVRFKLREAAVG